MNLNPRLSEWLDESYGVIVYQDQVLFIAVHIAGFSWGKAHKFRKALSKKKVEEVAGFRQDFLAGCVKNGMKRETAEQLFTLIEPFGGYGFNKPHAASYAVVAFYCAYLKANFTPEFMAATLTAVADDMKKVANAVVECKRLGVAVLGPNVNHSEQGFRVEHGGVRFGLLAIKGIGEGPIEEILKARQHGGPFTSLADFCTRVDPRAVGKGAMETLIKTGAMDSLEGEGKRHQMLEAVDRAISFGKSERALKHSGMVSLFGEMMATESAFSFALKTDTPEISQKQLLEWERDLIGVYVSRHPLSYLDHLLKEQVTHTVGEITEELDKQKVVLGGMIKEVRRITTKKGETMGVAKLEDMSGAIDLTIFPRIYEQTQELWEADQVVIVRGTVQIRNDEPGLLCDGAQMLEQVEEEMNRKQYLVWLTIRRSGADEVAVSNDIMKVQDLYQCVREFPGRDHYEILIEQSEWSVRLTPEENRIQYCQKLHERLEAILGKGMVEASAVRR